METPSKRSQLCEEQEPSSVAGGGAGERWRSVVGREDRAKITPAGAEPRLQRHGCSSVREACGHPRTAMRRIYTTSSAPDASAPEGSGRRRGQDRLLGEDLAVAVKQPLDDETLARELVVRDLTLEFVSWCGLDNGSRPPADVAAEEGRRSPAVGHCDGGIWI